MINSYHAAAAAADDDTLAIMTLM